MDVGFFDSLTHDPVRLGLAVGTAGAFALVCLWAGLRRGVTATGGSADAVVLYASQTGQAEDLARAAHAALLNGGHRATVMSMKAVEAETLHRAHHILVIASTTGEGDAPDEAVAFERTLMTAPMTLRGKGAAVLALGNRDYDHFCAFGHRVFDWLAASGADIMAPCIEADDLDPKALRQWAEVLGRLGAREKAQTDPFGTWYLKARKWLNPQGSAPLYQIDLVPQSGGLQWQSGDLVEIRLPDGHVRDYSIASLPTEGHVRLYVRAVTGDDGMPGRASGLLTHGLSVGGELRLRIKPHVNFHLPEGRRPLLLIGAGSGLAGLRAHIMSAKSAPWLIYGERHPARDGALCQDMTGLQASGKLSRLDLAFSQPGAGKSEYVQDRIAERADDLKTWLGKDGAVMICGGLDMGRAVEKALRQALGHSWIDTALANDRLRRDLY